MCFCYLFVYLFFSKIPVFFAVISGLLIARFSVQKVLEVSSNWTQYSHKAKSQELEFEFRVTCDAHYYGSGCTSLCRERNDNFGHYACTSNGERVCLAGWEGDYCQKRK